MIVKLIKLLEILSINYLNLNKNKNKNVMMLIIQNIKDQPVLLIIMLTKEKKVYIKELKSFRKVICIKISLDMIKILENLIFDKFTFLTYILIIEYKKINNYELMSINKEVLKIINTQLVY
jgi:hypothetical protein